MRQKGMLYKRRLVLLLAMVLTILSVLPVSAEPLSSDALNTVVTDEAVSINTPSLSEGEAEQAPENPAGQTDEEPVISADAAGTDPVNTDAVSDDTVSDDSVSDDSVSADAVSENGSISEDAAGAENTGASVSADVTVMYYLVGSNLERDSVQATRDMVEIMTGIKWAQDSHNKTASVNIIAETGGVSFDPAKGSSETRESLIKGNKSCHEWLKDTLYKASENDLKIYGAIEAAQINWEENHRWVLSSDKLTPAENDKDIKDRKRVMTGFKSEGKAPELIDFIETTVRDYPAKRYMLVLWDHGGGPKGGFGGDDRGTKENGYITSDQLSRSLSEAIAGAKKLETGDEYKLDKFSFIGFDACLMGNLETAMALQPYADYMYASEDLEAGTGWDHRGYVKLLYTVGSEMFVDDFNDKEHYPYYDEYIASTCERLGLRVADDNMAYYSDSDATFSMISLNGAGAAHNLKELDGALKDLAVVLTAQIASDNRFTREKYVAVTEAAEGAARFNEAGEGIVDIYSLCKELKEKNISAEVAEKAQSVINILKPAGYKGEYCPGNIVTTERYSKTYLFNKNKVSGDFPDYGALGGLTVFFPFENPRFVMEYEDTGEKELYDGMIDYVRIYEKGITDDKYRLSEGYRSFIKCFAGYRAIGKMLSDQYDQEPDAASKKMSEEVAKVKEQYMVSQANILSAFNSMCDVNGDIIKGKIDPDSMHMRTFVSDDRTIQAGYEVREAQAGIIKRLRREHSLTGTDGKQHKLGAVPDSNAPILSNDSDSNRHMRYTFDNFYNHKWFFIGNDPASVLSVRNDTPDGSQDFYNAFDLNTPVTALLPAAKKDKDGKLQCVVLEAQFDKASGNAVIKGYYYFDTLAKQLNSYVPWNADTSATDCFRPLSDMGEFMEGNLNSFNTLAVTNDYGDWVSGKDIPGLVTRNRSIDEAASRFENLKTTYDVKDIFGGYYELDSMSGGDRVTSAIRLSSNASSNVTVIEAGTKGISPVIEFYTSQYYIYPDPMPEIGYRDTDGKFHPISTSEDVASLNPGAYELVFKDFSSETGEISFDSKTALSVDGVDGPVDPSRYCFVPDENNTVLTVIKKADGLSIERYTDIPYGFVKTLKPGDDMAYFVSVFNGNGDISYSKNLEYTITANGIAYDLGKDVDIEKFRALEHKPGQVLSVSAILKGQDGKEILRTNGQAEIKVIKQDVKIVAVTGKKPYETCEHELDLCLWKDKEKGYEIPDIRVIMLKSKTEWNERSIDDGILTGDGKTIKLTDIISADNVSSVYLDESKIEGPGTYEKLCFGPDNGNERSREWSPEDFTEKFNTYYEVTDSDAVYLDKFIVVPDSHVRFLSMTDGSEIATDRYVYSDPKYLDDDPGKLERYTVSDNAVYVNGPEVNQWYIRIGNGTMVPVYVNDGVVSWFEDDLEKPLAEKQEKGGWKFYLPKVASSNNVWFYAGYGGMVSDFTLKSRENPYGISVDYVAPVEYTGRNIVTADSGKSGSKLLYLEVSASGNILTEGVDYTVSYKNNKNAGGPSSNKAPTMVITGKGKTYKGFKAEVKFTILPTAFSAAYLAAAKRYAPFTNKKLNVAINLSLPGGVKVPANARVFKYYDESDRELTESDYKNLYNGDSAKLVKIMAMAKIPAGKNPLINYIPNSFTEPVYVMGYPKGTKKITVQLKQNKSEFKAPTELSSIINGNIKTLKGKNVKTNKMEPISEDKITATAYYDRNLTLETSTKGTVLDRAGTYYIAFELKDEYKADYKAFNPTVVTYSLTGKKIAKGKTVLVSSNIAYVRAGENLPVTVKLDKAKCPAEEFLLTCTTRDGGVSYFNAGYAEDKNYDILISENGIMTVEKIDNGAVGSYKLTIEGRGGYTGKFTLTYKVK